MTILKHYDAFVYKVKPFFKFLAFRLPQKEKKDMLLQNILHKSLSLLEIYKCLKNI